MGIRCHTDYPGVQYSENIEADYAVISIKEPFLQPFDRIPNAYKLIMEYLQANNFKEKQQDNIISCFDYEYTNDGADYMDVLSERLRFHRKTLEEIINYQFI